MTTPDQDDVLDPYRRPDEVYAAMADRLVPAVTALLDTLGATNGGTAG